jgi:hypothetical protein
MCGPSQQEYNAQEQESSFMQDYSNAFNTRQASQTSLLNNINNTLNPILQAGPNQQGFSASELASYDTQALDTTGKNYANAERALDTNASAGGDSTVESGVQQQQKGALASEAAGTTSGEELGINEANYAQGRQNFESAVGGEESVAQLENPTAYGNLTQTANSTDFNESSQINQQSNQEEADIAGGITSLAGAALTGGASSVLGGLMKGGGGGGSGMDDDDF